MEDKHAGLKAAKLDLIRQVNNATDEEQVRRLMADLSEGGTANGCATNALCAEFETELLELFALVSSDPEVLNNPALKKMAERTIRFLRAFRNAANISMTASR